MSPSGCPACRTQRPLELVERHVDRIGGKSYAISRCLDCGVVSSEPRDAVGADWYEKAAPIRGKEARPAPESDWRFRQFLADRLPAGRLLDIGCGDGGFMRLARDRGFSATGFDYDARVVDRAKAAGLDAHAAEFSEFCKERTAGEFDLITLFDVLEHTPEPADFFEQAKRLLKKGGHVVITLPNALRPLPWGREDHDFPPHHFTRWTPEAMRGFLEREGFTVLRQEAGKLKLRYLSDHFFFYRVMPGVLAFAKRILFRGARSEDGATVSELYEKSGGSGVLGDKMRRQKLVNAARAAFQIGFMPVAVAMRWRYTRRQPLSGDCLYTLARRTA